MLRSLSSFVVVGACAALLACGGDDVDCSFTPCGGDPVGSWTIDGICFDTQGLFDDSSCPQASVNFAVDMTGSVTINADNTYSSQVTTVSSFVISIPGECLMGVTSCDQLADPDNGTNCSGDPADACDCTGATSETDTTTGSWSAAGTMLTLDGDPAEFCVAGNTMKVRTIPQDPGDAVTTIVMSR